MALNSRQIEKANWVLKAFDSGELQSHVTIDTSRKTGRKYNSPIIKIKLRIPSTGIPASTISKFKDGKWKPREKTLRKLSLFYNKYMYHLLRSQGANKENSRSFCRLLPKEISPILSRYRKWADRIKNNHMKFNRDVPLHHITWGMAHSNHTYNDYEQLSMYSGLGKERRSPVQRQSQWQH